MQYLSFITYLFIVGFPKMKIKNVYSNKFSVVYLTKQQQKKNHTPFYTR